MPLPTGWQRRPTTFSNFSREDGNITTRTAQRDSGVETLPTQTSSDWFLGVDLGTGSCKSAVLDSSGRVLGLGTGFYGQEDTGSWHEQDPETLLAGFVASVSAAVAAAGTRPGACAGLSIGGALHGVLALDAHEQPLTKVITWADDRAAAQAASVRQRADGEKLYQETGCPPHAMYPLYKIMWLHQEQPELFRRVCRFVSAKEYVLYRLTGNFTVDYALAAGSGLLNTHSLEWNRRSLELASIHPSTLASVMPPTTVLAGLDAEWARRLGLTPGTPLVLGSADAVNSSLGAGAVRPGHATCMVGTSGAYRLLSSRPVLDRAGRGWCYAVDPDHWLVGGAINNGGSALAWVRDLLSDMLPDPSSLGFEQLLARAAEIDAGAGGLICLPFFLGERSPNWNVNARALFFGLTARHGAGHVIRAVLEGVGFRFRSLQTMLHDMGLPVNDIRASGGFTRSPFWVQLMADVLNRGLSVPACGETSAVGAALWPMLAAGNAPDLESVADRVQLGAAFAPQVEAAAIYDQAYALYEQLYTSLSASGAFANIAALQDKLSRTVEG